MTSPGIYTEVVPYSPPIRPEQSIYSNCAELNLPLHYCVNDETVETADAGRHSQQHDYDDDLSTNDSSTTGDGVSGQDVVVEDLDSNQDGNNGSGTRGKTWDVKLRNNWKRQMRKKAAAGERKSKKSENRQSIGDMFSGSLSRWFSKATNRLSLSTISNDLSIFNTETAGTNGTDAERLPAECNDDDDEKDDGLWSDTEFDAEPAEEAPIQENLYANLNDLIVPRTRDAGPSSSKPQKPEKPSSTKEQFVAGASDSTAVSPTKLRSVHHRLQHSAWSCDDAVEDRRPPEPEYAKPKQVIAKLEAEEALRGATAKRKPPVAARPAGIKPADSVLPSADAGQQRRRTCPPNVLDVITAQAAQLAVGPSAASPPRTPEHGVDGVGGGGRASDVETSSGDSNSSGFSSGSSDVSRTTTGPADDYASSTLGRDNKHPKPVVKPKPCVTGGTMAANKRQVPTNKSNQLPLPDTQVVSTTVLPGREGPVNRRPPFSLPPEPANNVDSTQSQPGPAAGNVSFAAAAAAAAAADVRPIADSNSEDEGYEVAVSDESCVKKPLPPPPVVKSAGSKWSIWHRTQSSDNMPRLSKEQKRAADKQTPKPDDTKDGAGAKLADGRAIMPDLTQSMLNRAAGGLKTKVEKRNKSKNSDEIPAGSAPPKPTGMKVSNSEPDVGRRNKAASIPLTLVLPQLETQPWYFGNRDKTICEDKVRATGEDGAFVVRGRQASNDGCPYALTLLCDGQLYHMLIRRRDNGKFSLGAMEKPDQHVFTSVVELVCFYANNPIHLTTDPTSGAVLGKVLLTTSPAL